MLYYKHSFNYYVRIMFYMRLRVLAKILSRFGRWTTDRRELDLQKMVGIRGNQDLQVWDLHYRNFLRNGWTYLRAQNFVHHCTDGPECPIAYAFSKPEAASLFKNFRDVDLRVAHFPLQKYSSRIPFRLEKFLAKRFGWYLFIFATKPASEAN
jgi:hypothetical protein